MEEYTYDVRVPKERIAVIIGQKGGVKKALQDHAKIKIHVDSQEGIVTLQGEDSIALYASKQVIKAIARGFNPEVAQLLLRPDYTIEIIRLDEYANTKDSMLRLKGRVIGLKGKSRERLQELTECFLSVYGKTVCIVGDHQHAAIARRAVEKLLQGSMHKTIWRFLELQRRKLREGELSGG